MYEYFENWTSMHHHYHKGRLSVNTQFNKVSTVSKQDICMVLYSVCDTHLYTAQVGTY